jgi:cell division protein FtsL
MTVCIILSVIALLLFVGMLIGHALTTQALQARTKRQAAMQHSLNSQWQELENQWKQLEIVRSTIPQRGKDELSSRPLTMTTSGSTTRP